jgi:hypothetical protein
MSFCSALAFTEAVAEDDDEKQEEEQHAAFVFKQSAVAEYDHEYQEEEQKAAAVHFGCFNALFASPEQSIQEPHG